MYEEIDLKGVVRNSEAYAALNIFNREVQKHVKDFGGMNLEQIDSALKYAHAYYSNYLNEHGEYDMTLDGKPVFVEPTKAESANYALLLVQLNDKEKKEFRKVFYGSHGIWFLIDLLSCFCF